MRRRKGGQAKRISCRGNFLPSREYLANWEWRLCCRKERNSEHFMGGTEVDRNLGVFSRENPIFRSFNVQQNFFC